MSTKLTPNEYNHRRKRVTLLFAACEKLGLTDADLAAYLGLTHSSSVTHWRLATTPRFRWNEINGIIRTANTTPLAELAAAGDKIRALPPLPRRHRRDARGTPNPYTLPGGSRVFVPPKPPKPRREWTMPTPATWNWVAAVVVTALLTLLATRP